MTIIIICVAAIVVLGTVTALLSRGSSDDEIKVAAGDCSSCDGNDPKCEQACMMEAATKEIEYYDDEELDMFRGRDAADYTDDEAEQFREVLYSMRQEDVAGWNRSLILREINVPNQIRDELIMMIGG